MSTEISLFLISLVVVSVLLIVVIVVLLIPRKSVRKIVKKMVEEDKDIGAVLEVGRAKKWNERETKLYFLLYTMQDFLENGYNLIEIEDMAIGAGWPKDLVYTVLGKLR